MTAGAARFLAAAHRSGPGIAAAEYPQQPCLAAGLGCDSRQRMTAATSSFYFFSQAPFCAWSVLGVPLTLEQHQSAAGPPECESVREDPPPHGCRAVAATAWHRGLCACLTVLMCFLPGPLQWNAHPEQRTACANSTANWNQTSWAAISLPGTPGPLWQGCHSHSQVPPASTLPTCHLPGLTRETFPALSICGRNLIIWQQLRIYWMPGSLTQGNVSALAAQLR